MIWFYDKSHNVVFDLWFFWPLCNWQVDNDGEDDDAHTIFSGQESKLFVPGVARASLDCTGFLLDWGRGYSLAIPGIASPSDPAAISASRWLNAPERRPPSAPPNFACRRPGTSCSHFRKEYLGFFCLYKPNGLSYRDGIALILKIIRCSFRISPRFQKNIISKPRKIGVRITISKVVRSWFDLVSTHSQSAFSMDRTRSLDDQQARAHNNVGHTNTHTHTHTRACIVIRCRPTAYSSPS